MAKVRRSRQREKAGQLLLRQPRGQRPRRPKSRPARKIAAWFQGDNQGRTYDDPQSGDAPSRAASPTPSQDGNFAAANVTAAYSTGVVRWRNASKNPDEAKMWLNETLASGMIPYYHFIGSEAGFGEDRRWQKVGTDYFRWTAQT